MGLAWSTVSSFVALVLAGTDKDDLEICSCLSDDSEEPKWRWIRSWHQ
jgi:hypothetical protein